MTRLAALRLLWLALALATLIMLLVEGEWLTFLVALVSWAGGIVTAVLWPDVRRMLHER